MYMYFFLLSYIKCFSIFKLIFVFLQIMKDLKLLPLQDGETVEQKVAVFRRMDDLVTIATTQFRLLMNDNVKCVC